ncbi:MAG: DUF3078 domain-containing protein, partial [Bacteroidetes bacterium]
MKQMCTFLLAACCLLATTVLCAQSTEELEAMKAEKSAQLAELQGQLDELSSKVDALSAELASITDQLTPYPRWKTGLLGNVGLNFSNFNTWLLRAQPNTNSINIGFASTVFANGQWEKSFWRNSANLNLGWIKFDNKDVPDTQENEDFQVSSDAFNIVSLYGFKLSPKFAISTLGEYRTSVLEGRFNDPGYLDLGLGATWTPIEDLVVVMHPLNYNFVF